VKGDDKIPERSREQFTGKLQKTAKCKKWGEKIKDRKRGGSAKRKKGVRTNGENRNQFHSKLQGGKKGAELLKGNDNKKTKLEKKGKLGFTKSRDSRM